MNEFKVGVMALVTMAAVVVLSLKVTSNQSGFGEYTTYKTVVRDASGIFPKTPIKVAGINAGRIKSIELEGNNALITFEVLNQVKVPSDSQLRIRATGFLGDKYLEIFVGRSQEKLKENGFIESDEGGGVETLVREANEVMKDVKIIMSSLKDSIKPEGQEPPIKKILQDFQVMAKNAKEMSESLKKVVSGNEERLNTIIANLEDFSENISYQTDNTQPESAMAEIQEILRNAEILTEDLQEIVADVKAGKGTLGKILVEEDIADEVKQTLSGVNRMVGRVDAIRTEVSIFVGANTDYGADNVAKLKIYPSPERFYLLGVSSLEYGPKEEKEYVNIDENGNRTTRTEIIREKDELRFDVQIGRIFHNWTIRGGFIESKAGVGVDYNIWDWGTTFQAEMFDYRDQNYFNLRLAMETQLWNVLYARVSGYELLYSRDRSATFSVGLRFNDEDLKGLLGFFL